MSEHIDREIGPLTKAALENYLHPKPIEQRIYALKQLISDVNDANLYGLSQLEERIDALERRIEVLERKLNHKGGDE